MLAFALRDCLTAKRRSPAYPPRPSGSGGSAHRHRAAARWSARRTVSTFRPCPSAKSRCSPSTDERWSVTNPRKPFFPALGLTKLDLVRYYLAVAPGAVLGVKNRPMALKRFPNGADEPFFFQKRAPAPRPEWVTTAQLAFPPAAPPTRWW